MQNNLTSSSLNRSSFFDSSLLTTQTRSRDRNFNIGTRSSFERSERLRGRDRRDVYRFELRRTSFVSIQVVNRDLFLGASIRLRLERSNGSNRVNRTISPGLFTLIERRLSSGTYRIQLSSREDTRYRINYRRRQDPFRSDDFDFFS